MDLATARKLLPDIRSASDLASPLWSESYDTTAMRAEICVENTVTGEVEPIAALLPDCSHDDRRLMIRSPEYVAALLVLLNEAFRVIRELQPKQAKPKDFAAECAMKCANDHLFRRYLAERHQLEATDLERIKTRVRSLLAVQSMGELNKDENARKRWQSLRNDFDNWRRAR
ncbi:hypothetical protein [Sinorhizobium sp. BG8]|uniref:hypothetical protein n=1 Tax=Sinorhizobium sp. BG8 TaxID=2613773 RepID=UPI00193E3ABC|nr:hypothetical protein [Sinorhizobium sp. BG8]QRM55115.1 hypothetical protein F3Y30_11665 [Sinorhizobium sp. BG8]